MTATLANFTSETQLGTSDSQLVATTSTEKKFIGKATFTNTSAAAVEVTVWRIATTTTATTGSGGNWLDKRTIQPGKVWECDKLMGHVLGNSMQIRAVAGAASVINADLSGVTES
jgi:hypothetical protein